jgi:hypothetical protein
MNDYAVSHIRTYIPIGIGVVATWLLSYGIDIDGPELATAVTAAASAVYYGVVRLLAERWPLVGVLLGVNQAPTYD